MIPLTRPILDFDAVADDFRRIFDSGTLTRGEYVARFETAIADYVGTAHAVATTSATTSLHLALVAAGVGPGDEVLVSDFTFPATGNVIAQCGAVPVPVDCRPGEFLLDLDDAAAKVTPRTRALLPVDPFGQPIDLTAASELAVRHGLLLLEDAACALGGTSDGRRCGSWPGAAAFSFHPRKIITTGEGGVLTTNDDGLADRARLLRNHGGAPGEVAATFVAVGFNYRMSELQAALGLAQLAKIDDLLAGRRAAAMLYVERLRARGVTIPGADLPGATFQSFVVLLADGVDRDGVVLAMRRRGIETTLGTYALHAQPVFGAYGFAAGDCPHSWRAQQQSLTLPLWPGMPEATIEQVVTALDAALTETA